MKGVKYLVACSGGNDSVALIQYMMDAGEKFSVVYNDTGWSRNDWPERIAKISSWCFGNGVTFYVTKSEGMEALVRRKKGWPMPASKMQFCTKELKEGPTLELLDKIDPDGDLVIVTGRRREESQNRSKLAFWLYESAKHGGRDVWNPIANLSAKERDELILRAGFHVLPHSSMECYPCVCANKKDLREMRNDSERISEIEKIELDMGFTRNGKPRTMFRPYRVGGGVGIRQAVEWGSGPVGYKSTSVPKSYKFNGLGLNGGCSDLAYDESTKEGKEFARQCDGGYCGL